MIPFHSLDAQSSLKHPMNLLYRRPDVFSIEGPLPATYSPWQDPQYWNTGANTTFNPRSQLRAIARNLADFLVDPYMAPIWSLVAGCVVLFLANLNAQRPFQLLVKFWPLLVPGAAGLFVYALILVQPRYIAPFTVLVFLGAFPYILVQRPLSKFNAIATLATAVSVFGISAMFIALHLAKPIPALLGHGGENYRASQSLIDMGVRPGEAVAIVGSGWDAMVWARLARVRIIAQIPPEDANDFWRISDPQRKAEVYDAFARAGAKAIVTEETPPSTGFTEWQGVGNTRYHVHFLDPSGNQPIGISIP
jgi:hypothetical protein